MNFLPRLSRMLGGSTAAASAPASQLAPHSAPPTTTSANDPRRELLRVALRDTLRRHGIPESWISAEMLRSNSRGRSPGIHWRLTIRHWDARLPACLVALQESLVGRVQGYDPVESDSWLHGISWQFRIEEGRGWPALPHPGSWTAPPREHHAAAPAPLDVDPVLIQGPVHVGATQAERRAQLDQMLSGMDEEFRAAALARANVAERSRSFMKTEPAALR